MSLQPKSTVVVHKAVEAQVEKTPQAVAISFLKQQITYRQLNESANQLAHYLRYSGIQSGSTVGVFAERSLDQMIAILAILKAGAAYLPLDLAYPVDRLDYMLSDSQASMLITQEHLLSKIEHKNLPTFCLDLDAELTANFPKDNLNCDVSVDDAAYVIYTSGSTGKPKGVLMPHKPLANLLQWQKTALTLPEAATLQFTPVSFDVSFQEIFSTLSSGGKLVLIQESTRLNPEALLAYLNEHRIERLFLPFVALQHIAEVAVNQPEVPTCLQEVITAGEQLKITRSISRWFEQMNSCKLHNHYGPSESHVVTAYTLRGPAKDWPHLPPIGQAVDNAQLYLINPESQRKGDTLTLVEPGEAGELAIGGITLAKGYINKPDLTDSKFIADPFSTSTGAKLYRTGDLVRLSPDGNYEYIDRLDNQVKIRGFRIELGEIEATLSQATFTQDVAVIACENEKGVKQLIAYIVGNKSQPDGYQTLIRDCKNYLKETLPSYMVPSIFVEMDVLPLTPSGKVNRRALPEPEYSRPDLDQALVLPQTSTEKKLSGVWLQLLGIEPIGICDNFFDLGGTSLQVVQLNQLIEKTFEIKLPISAFFENPTIQKLSIVVEEVVSAGDKFTYEEDSKALEKDTCLDEAITVEGCATAVKTQLSNIFLTGGTGYFGAFLLHELLQKTAADIYCLVRAETLDKAKARLQGNLENSGLWNQRYDSRIIPVIGDLNETKLGIDNTVFEALAQRIDAIYHCGAWVNMIYPYSKLKHSNVFATQEILALASKTKVKPVHFISTIDVFSVDEGTYKIVDNQDYIGPVNLLCNGYARSKYVAEQLVMAASKRGIPVSIYRPSNIVGPVQAGTHPKNSLVSLIIEGCIQLGAAPKINSMMNLVPADYASQLTVYLSLNQEASGQAFNVVSPKSVSWEETILGLTQSGYSIESVAYEDWLSRLHALPESSENVLTPLLTILKDKKLVRKSLGAFYFDTESAHRFFLDNQLSIQAMNHQFLNAYFSYSRIFQCLNSVTQ